MIGTLIEPFLLETGTGPNDSVFILITNVVLTSLNGFYYFLLNAMLSMYSIS
jgi:hypothetical protein